MHPILFRKCAKSRRLLRGPDKFVHFERDADPDRQHHLADLRCTALESVNLAPRRLFKPIASAACFWQTGTISLSGARTGIMVKMTKNDVSNAGSNTPSQDSAGGSRAPWTSPRVIVSDLGDARGANVIPGADGASGSYTYGS